MGSNKKGAGWFLKIRWDYLGKHHGVLGGFKTTYSVPVLELMHIYRVNSQKDLGRFFIFQGAQSHENVAVEYGFRYPLSN